MSFSFPFSYDKEISLPKDADSVLNFLKTYTQALPPLFPGLRRFEMEAPNVYFWEFDAIKYKGTQLTVFFRTRFEESPQRIGIHPCSPETETHLSGEWLTVPTSHGCILKMHFHLDFSVPLPKLMKGIIAPLATAELSKLFDRYAKNLQQHFN